MLARSSVSNWVMGRAILFVLLASCANCAAQTPLPSIEALELFDSWLYSAFSKGDLISSSHIRAIGKIVEESSVPYEMGYAEGRWNVITYRFDGLVIVAIVQETPPQRALVQRITIQNSSWPLTNGLVVGTPVSNIRMSVPPSENPLQYCGTNDCLEFEEEEGRISKITLSFYAE